VLAYRLGWDFALQVLDKIAANTRFNVRKLSENELNAVTSFIRESRKKMAFNDYVVLSLCLKECSEPLSFDRQLVSMAKRGQ